MGGSGDELLANNLNDDFAATRLRIELEERDLLPLTDQQLAVGKRNGHGRTQHGGAHVARAVVVAPSQMMPILTISRRERLEDVVEISCLCVATMPIIKKLPRFYPSACAIGRTRVRLTQTDQRQAQSHLVRETRCAS